MHYRGKVIGFILGILSGIGLWGILLGLIIGHLYDSAIGAQPAVRRGNNQHRQQNYFRITFEVMGHLTKSKGRVTQANIQVANSIMQRMQLSAQARQSAQQAFNAGKNPNYPLRESLRQLRAFCAGRYDLLQMFLEIQIQAALAEGQLHYSEKQILYIIAEELGISRQQFDYYLHLSGIGAEQQRRPYPEKGGDLAAAYRLLDVQPTDDAIKIKRAYRRMMANHHPDKLVAKGLPPEMTELAKEKTQAIQAAYDQIRKARGFR
jgi:DnaJ like chaperone protein